MQRRSGPVVRRLGVTPEMLRWVHSHLGIESANLQRIEARNAVILMTTLLFGFLFLARGGEFPRVQEVDDRKILRGIDMCFKDSEGQSTTPPLATRLDVQFRQTKADQLAFGCTRTHWRDPTGICIVGLCAKLFRAFPERFEGGSEHHLPFCRWVGGAVISHIEIQNAIKRSALGVGLPPERFSCHSLRIGGASAMYNTTNDSETVKRFGRWASTTFQRYLWDSAERSQGLAARMMGEKASLHLL
eukprot:6468491-Amphidinium_carterae.3